MSQGSLLDASVYVLRAYDQLVLAYNEQELEELRSLKMQVIRGYVSLQERNLSALTLADPPFTMESQISQD